MLKRLVRPLLAPLVRALRPRREDLPLSTFRLAHAADGAITLDGVRLGALLGRWGSPLHVVDGAKLAQNAADFLAVPPGAARGAEVTYSFKTDPIPGVIRRLHAAGVGAEVISAYELWLALENGFAPEEIVYNGPAKSPVSLRHALEREIGLVNVNSRCEIAPLAAMAREMGKRPKVGVRVVVPGGWGGQLGERIDTGAALRAFAEARRFPELRVVALHAHLGGEIATAERLSWFVGEALAFTDVLRKELGLELSVLDLGGSFACPTVRHKGALEARLNVAFGADLLPRDPASVIPIRDAVALVVRRVEEHYRARSRPAPRVILEPGRALTGDAQMLLTRVVNVQDEVDGVTHAVLDAGICVASPVPDEVHQLYPLAAPRRGGRRAYRLTGPICSPADVLYPCWHLPPLRPGDALAIMSSGAYFVPFASSFSFPQPGVAMIEGGVVTLLREPETFAHMTALDVAPKPSERAAHPLAEGA
jgi:diaminopimelate decarboxylase